MNALEEQLGRAGAKPQTFADTGAGTDDSRLVRTLSPFMSNSTR